MGDADDEPEIIFSELGGRYTRQHHTIEVHIYRGEDEVDWILEVEDPAGGSTVWEDRFPTDREALEEFRRTLKTEGVQSFLFDELEQRH